jgi:hypothetical protein
MVTDDPARGDAGAAGLPAPPASKITPDSLEEFRRKLSTGAEEIVNPKTWSGSLPNQWGTAPMLRVGRSKWFNLLWLLAIGFALLLAGVVVAQALRELPSVQAFIEKYPGNIPPPNGQQGIPAWANLAALLQPVHDDLHHPVGNPDPHRPSPVVLDPPLHARKGLVSLPEGGAARSALDR